MIVSKLARTTINYGFYIPKGSNKENVFRRAARRKIAEEVASSAASNPIPITLGRGLVAGASVLGLGSLAYYGLGLSNKSGFIDRSGLWPQFVRDRIRSTYEYFGTSLGITAAAAYFISRNPTLMNLAMRNSMMTVFASIALLIGSGMLVRSIPYDVNNVFSAKTMAWALHASLVGGVVAPLTMLGGPLLLQAAWMTAGVIGGLSILAATAPSEKFLNMGGPLAIGLGVVFTSSIAGLFIPPVGKLGLSLYSITVYGGLVLFSMFLLFDTQKIVHRAENQMQYDPVNESISIYLDTINIFIRILTIMTNRNRK